MTLARRSASQAGIFYLLSSIFHLCYTFRLIQNSWLFRGGDIHLARLWPLAHEPYLPSGEELQDPRCDRDSYKLTSTYRTVADCLLRLSSYDRVMPFIQELNDIVELILADAFVVADPAPAVQLAKDPTKVILAGILARE